jgi:hypothetical protein
MISKTIRLGVFMMLALFAPSLIISASDKNKEKKKAGRTIVLLKQNSLDNWVFHLKDKTADPESVFSVHDGILHITGDPYGYMRTKETYADYTLHVEWRWPADPTNSGVFIHAQPPDSIWLRCIECQLKAGNAGDFVCMNGAEMSEKTDKSRVVPKMAESSEKSAGEWNILEVRCSGNTIEVYVNGVLQNKGTNLNITNGSICLQSEGRDIEFRNVFLTK